MRLALETLEMKSACDPDYKYKEQRAIQALRWALKQAPRLKDGKTNLVEDERPVLTNDRIIEIAKSTATAEPGTDGYVLPVSFAREIEKELLRWKTVL